MPPEQQQSVESRYHKLDREAWEREVARPRGLVDVEKDMHLTCHSCCRECLIGKNAQIECALGEAQGCRSLELYQGVRANPGLAPIVTRDMLLSNRRELSQGKSVEEILAPFLPRPVEAAPAADDPPAPEPNGKRGKR